MVAIRLRTAGRQVTLLEKETCAHHKVCGDFLSPEAVHYLRQVGIHPLDLGAATIRLLRLSSKRRVIQTPLPFTALSLSRFALDEAMLACAQQSGCNVQRGVCVDQLTTHDGLWHVRLRGGQSLCAHTVFLATGKHDLRGWHRSPSLQNDLVGFKLYWRLAPVQTAALRESIEIFLFRGGYGGLSLVENDVANLCLVVRRARLRSLGGWSQLLASVLKKNRQIQQRLHGATPVGDRPLAISSIPYGYLAARPCGLWRLGDQAAVIPSFTGDGMSIALHSAALAAAMYLAGQSPDQYQRTLHAQLSPAMSLATGLSRAVVTRAGRSLAPFALSIFPHALRWIAASTRIPTPALLPHLPPGRTPRSPTNPSS
jgi:flavin-dependent dehydrogenase